MYNGRDMTEKQPAILDGVEIGVGTWAWGNRMLWDYGRSFQLGDLKEAFDHSLRAGVRFFDTAEIYGQGQSEQILGGFLAEAQSPVIIATKFMPFPWRLTRDALLKALKGSLNRLGVKSVDLYQIHMPFPPVGVETWMDAMAEACESGLIRGVGVSNYDAGLVRTAVARLRRSGLNLVSNQVEYSLVNRKIERNGVRATCDELGVKIMAYSPLAMGVLTGKYTPENPMPGGRSFMFPVGVLRRVQPLIRGLKQIGEAHGGMTPAQVALNWTICKGTLPIPGAKTGAQAVMNAAATGWRLSADEVGMLDELSDQVTRKR